METLPTSAVGVLDQFSPTKAGIIEFSAQVINEVEDGKRDPLEILLLCKTLEEVAKKVREGTKEHQAKEAAKYGERPFMLQGAELHLTATKTDYKYEVCEDPIYNRLVETLEEAQRQVKQREEFLKSLPEGGQMIVDESTGEAVRVRRPAKFQTMGVKVTLK